MNLQKVAKCIRCLMLMPVLALTLAITGCESEDTDEDITATRFHLDRELVSYSSTDEYQWETTLDQTLVTLRIKDFRTGDASVRIIDSRGKTLYVGGFNTADNALFDGDDLFFQRLSDKGEPGTWTVVLGYDDFTGDYDLSLE